MLRPHGQDAEPQRPYQVEDPRARNGNILVRQLGAQGRYRRGGGKGRRGFVLHDARRSGGGGAEQRGVLGEEPVAGMVGRAPHCAWAAAQRNLYYYRKRTIRGVCVALRGSRGGYHSGRRNKYNLK